MGRADLHIHSTYSHDGTSTIPAILKQASEKAALDIIAITDHDTMAGVAEAQALAPLYGIEVIPGMEISTSQGHLVALFIHNPVPANLPLLDTLLRVRDQGGICIAPHIEAHGTSSLKYADIFHVLQFPLAAQVLIGVELFNGGLVYTRNWRKNIQLIQSLPLAQVGASDAHFLQMIGKCVTLFPGKKPVDLLAAMQKHQTQVPLGKGLGGWQALTSYVPRYFLKKLGFAVWNEHPQKPFRLKRLQQIESSPVQSNFV